MQGGRLTQSPKKYMADRSHILAATYAAVVSTNEALPSDRKLAQTETEPIIGEGARLDSLGFVSLFLQRKMRNVDCVVEHAHGAARQFPKRIAVERCVLR